jgi:hypothetical protein
MEKHACIPLAMSERVDAFVCRQAASDFRGKSMPLCKTHFVKKSLADTKTGMTGTQVGHSVARALRAASGLMCGQTRAESSSRLKSIALAVWQHRDELPGNGLDLTSPGVRPYLENLGHLYFQSDEVRRALFFYVL